MGLSVGAAAAAAWLCLCAGRQGGHGCMHGLWVSRGACRSGLTQSTLEVEAFVESSRAFVEGDHGSGRPLLYAAFAEVAVGEQGCVLAARVSRGACWLQG